LHFMFNFQIDDSPHGSIAFSVRKEKNKGFGCYALPFPLSASVDQT
jgi:hypothetical protein